eukprot:gene13091-17545_t
MQIETNNMLNDSCGTQLLSIGVDLGGSHISCIAMDSKGNIYHKICHQIVQRDVDCILELIVKCCNEIKEAVEGFSSNQNGKCAAIGIGIPGNIDPVTGIARYLPNFGWNIPVPIKQYLNDNHILVPISMRNDGRCAAIAEAKFGVGIQSRVFAMLTLGTGIGGALLHNGVLFDGSTFDAGDFGHHTICSGVDAFDCVCGKKGCFEYHASAEGLVRHYKRVGGNPNVKNAEEVILQFRAIDQNNENDSLNQNIAAIALKKYKDDLSTGLANLITFYNPDTIAIGGGLSKAHEVFDGLVDLVDAKTLPATRGKVIIVPAALSSDAGVIGAALLGFDSL